MLRLDVGQAGERVRVEAEQETRHQSGHPAVCPARDHECHRPPGQREARDEHQVVGQHRRSAEPAHRRGESGLHDERFGVRERIGLRMEDVGLKEPAGVVDGLVHDPRQDPFVQHRVGVVVARQAGRIARERPGVQRRRGPTKSARHAARGHRERASAAGCRPIVASTTSSPGAEQQHDRACRNVQPARGRQRPVRGAARREPPGRHSRKSAVQRAPAPFEAIQPAVLHVVHDDEVGAGLELDLARALDHLVHAAVVDDRTPIDRQPRPIVGRGREGVGAGHVDRQVSVPAGTKLLREGHWTSPADLAGRDVGNNRRERRVGVSAFAGEVLSLEAAGDLQCRADARERRPGGYQSNRDRPRRAGRSRRVANHSAGPSLSGRRGGRGRSLRREGRPASSAGGAARRSRSTRPRWWQRAGPWRR